MTRYLEILAMQTPFPAFEDEFGRPVFSVNFLARAEAPVASWEQELAQAIQTAGLGTRNTDLFIGSEAEVPATGGPYIHVISTGGTAPETTHDDNRFERLSAQILVRADDYITARDRILAIWRSLDGRYNVELAA